MKFILVIFLLFISIKGTSQERKIDLGISFYSNFSQIKYFPHNHARYHFKSTLVLNNLDKIRSTCFSLEMHIPDDNVQNFNLQFGQQFKIIRKKVNLNYTVGSGPFITLVSRDKSIPTSYMIGLQLNNNLEFGKQFEKMGFFIAINGTCGAGYYKYYYYANSMKTTIYSDSNLGFDFQFSPFFKINYRF